MGWMGEGGGKAFQYAGILLDLLSNREYKRNVQQIDEVKVAQLEFFLTNLQ